MKELPYMNLSYLLDFGSGLWEGYLKADKTELRPVDACAAMKAISDSIIAIVKEKTPMLTLGGQTYTDMYATASYYNYLTLRATLGCKEAEMALSNVGLSSDEVSIAALVVENNVMMNNIQTFIPNDTIVGEISKMFNLLTKESNHTSLALLLAIQHNVLYFYIDTLYVNRIAKRIINDAGWFELVSYDCPNVEHVGS